MKLPTETTPETPAPAEIPARMERAWDTRNWLGAARLLHRVMSERPHTSAGELLFLMTLVRRTSLTNEKLAKELGIRREMVSVWSHRFQREGLINIRPLGPGPRSGCTRELSAAGLRLITGKATRKHPNDKLRDAAQ